MVLKKFYSPPRRNNRGREVRQSRDNSWAISIHSGLLCLAIIIGLITTSAIAENLIENSSFEVGPGKWGCDTHRLGKKSAGHTFIKDNDIDKFGELGAKDGAYALRIYSKAGKKVRSLKLTSQAIQVTPGATYSFSAWGKIDTKDIAGTLRVIITNKDTDAAHRFDKGKKSVAQTVVINKRISAASRWKKLKKNNIKLNGNRFDFYYVSARFIPDKNKLKNDGVCWLDAIQLEKSSSAGNYSPKNPLQAGAIFTDPNNIMVKDTISSDETVKIRFHNASEKDVTDIPVDCIVYDLFGNPFRFNAPQFSATKGKGDEATMSLSKLNKGFYRIVLSLEGNPVDEKLFAVLPSKRNLSPEESMAGAYMQLLDDVLRPLSKAGFHWSATLSVAGGIGRWNRVQPKASDSIHNKAKIMTRAIRRAGDTYGIKIIGNISGIKRGFFPKWVPTETFKYNSYPLKVPTTTAYATFAKKLAIAYKNDDHKISHWIIEDEADQIFSKSSELLRAYAQRYSAAYAAIMEVQPDAKIAPSGRLEFVQKVAKQTAHSMNYLNLGEFSPGVYRNCRNWLKKNNSGEIGIWGIKREYSINPYTIYPDFENRDLVFEPRLDAKTSLLHVLQRTKYTAIHLAYDARIIESRSYNMHSKSLLTFDGSLTPRAVALASLWWMTDGTVNVNDDEDNNGVPDGDRISSDGKLYTYLFKRRKDNKYILAVATIDGPCDKLEIRIPENTSELTIYDGFTNLSTDSQVISVASINKETTITFNELGFYIESDSKDKLFDWAKAISHSRVKYVTVPMARRSKADFHKRDKLEVGPFSVITTESHNFRLFFQGEEIIEQDEVRLMPLRDYPKTRTETTTTTILESEAKVITRLVSGTAEITRTIALTTTDCTITWNFTNHSAKKQENHLYVCMNDRFP